jgi:hypothetical protein
MGRYQIYLGSKTCTTLCPVGTYSNTGADSCSACASGKYASSEGASECVECPKGYAQISEGQSGCVACPVGKSTDDQTGSLECVACPPDKYAQFVGTPQCYEQEREVPDNKDITATISVMAAMAVLVTILGFTYWHRDTIFGTSSHESESESTSKDVEDTNRA